MLLALRPGPAADAGVIRRLGVRYIKWHLHSDFCHGGIVLDGQMLHVNMPRGLHASDYTRARWLLVDLGPRRDELVRDMFRRLEGAKYDYFSELAFVLPASFTDAKRLYCFEWCALCLGVSDRQRCTPEYLLLQALRQGAHIVHEPELALWRTPLFST